MTYIICIVEVSPANILMFVEEFQLFTINIILKRPLLKKY